MLGIYLNSAILQAKNATASNELVFFGDSVTYRWMDYSRYVLKDGKKIGTPKGEFSLWREYFEGPYGALDFAHPGDDMEVFIFQLVTVFVHLNLGLVSHATCLIFNMP